MSSLSSHNLPQTKTITNLINRLRLDYPDYKFKTAEVSCWSPRDNTIYYHGIRKIEDQITLIHELGHAIKGHQSYHQDIELIRYEREAWETARKIAPVYGVEINDDIIENALESYRKWLHARSRCPHCQSPGVQSIAHLSYRCVICESIWTANDARQCGLKRYTKTQPS